jgi:hypothetical protein
MQTMTLTQAIREVEDEIFSDEEFLDSISHFNYDRDPPREPLLPFAFWLEVQAQRIRLKGGTAAIWLAGKIDDLADDARSLRAATPEQFDARNDAMLEYRAMEAGGERRYDDDEMPF